MGWGRGGSLDPGGGGCGGGVLPRWWGSILYFVTLRRMTSLRYAQGELSPAGESGGGGGWGQCCRRLGDRYLLR